MAKLELPAEGSDFYGVDQVESVRSDLIEIRNAALKVSNFGVCVSLSHAVAILYGVAKFMREQEEDSGDNLGHEQGSSDGNSNG